MSNKEKGMANMTLTGHIDGNIIKDIQRIT